MYYVELELVWRLDHKHDKTIVSYFRLCLDLNYFLVCENNLCK
jgi:hypothetical protein